MKTQHTIAIIFLSTHMLSCHAIMSPSEANKTMNFEAIGTGGKRYNQQNMQPLTNVNGEIIKLDAWFYKDGETKSISIEDNELHISISPDNFHETYKYTCSLTPKLRLEITNWFYNSGLTTMNGWQVETNGLPLTIDGRICCKFSSSEKLYISFNGGDMPPKFNDAFNKFFDQIEKLTDYNESKCKPIKPYVSPYLGTHKFIYQDGNKSQQFIVTIENTTGNDNCELISIGDFGNEHIRINANKIYGGKDQYFLSIRNYYNDSTTKPHGKDDLAGRIENRNGNLTFIPYIIGQNLPQEAKEIKELLTF